MTVKANNCYTLIGMTELSIVGGISSTLTFKLSNAHYDSLAKYLCI